MIVKELFKAHTITGASYMRRGNSMAVFATEKSLHMSPLGVRSSHLWEEWNWEVDVDFGGLRQSLRSLGGC